MKVLIILTIFLSFLFSCSTLRSYEKENTTISRDTIVKIDTIRIPDTIRISETKIVKGEVIRDTVTIYKILSGTWESDTIWAYTKYAYAWAYIYNNVPFLGIKQDDIDVLLNSYKVHITVLEKQLTERDKLVEKRYFFYENPWFWSSIVLFILLVFILFLIIRAK